MKTDLFLYTTEQLNKLTSSDIIKQGHAYFTEHRVLALNTQDEVITSQVVSASRDRPYWVVLAIKSDNELHVQCDCRSETKFCKHIIATLYRYAAACLNKEQEHFEEAVNEAISERIKKGCNEVRVKLSTGNLAFGTWQAKSIISATYRPTSYHVYIRSLAYRKNYCTCPDIATNRLGTCKHIEAVLHYAQKQPGYAAFLALGADTSFVYLAWESATDPVIRLHKALNIDLDLCAELTRFFTSDHRFKGRLPEDFNDFSEKFATYPELDIGDDAILYVRQKAEDASQKIKAENISCQIIQANGILPGIKVGLFPYQIEGVAFLASRGRALLADDMGLGKTFQAMTASIWLAEHAGVNKVLIVCPVSLQHQWAREIKKFTSQTVQILQGPLTKREKQYRADAFFYIVNYEQILRDLTIISGTLKPDLLILDEAQKINNWRTKIASTIKLISSRYVFVLTGTPLDNRIEDLYSLLQVVDARVLGPLWRCLLDFHITDEHGKVTGYRNLPALRQRISSVLLRRNRSLVSDQLPDTTEVRLDIPMTQVQQDIHDAGMSSAKLLANKAQHRPLTSRETDKLMSSLQQVRMACNAAGLVDKITKGSPKLKEVSRLLEELCQQSNQKIVIYSQWAMMTEMVESLVHSHNIGCVHSYGSIPKHKRTELVDKFQHDDAIQVFISTDTGAIDLNLQAGTVLINLDIPWNPAILEQRTVSMYRLGKKQKIQVFLLQAADSYEQQVVKLVSSQSDLFNHALSPDVSEETSTVSKKMLQLIVDDLTQVAPPDLAAPDSIPPQKQPARAQNPTPSRTLIESVAANSATRALITQIQTHYKHRIDRILVLGEGLLVVLNRTDPTDDDWAGKLSTAETPFVAITIKTYINLQRLSASSPIAQASIIYAAQEQQQEIITPLIKVAQDKLRSAEILVEQQCYSEVMEILAVTILSVITIASGQQHPPCIEKSIVWLYSDILPQQFLNAEQITTAVRIIALSQSINVPDTLIQQSLLDTQKMLAQYS